MTNFKNLNLPETLADRRDLELLTDELTLARQRKSTADIALLTKRLAELGVPSAMSEYAKMLSAGNFFPKNPELAKAFYLRSALDGDPEAAYGVSTLSIGEDERFWLLLSAVLGCESAFVPASEILFAENVGTLALFFLSESAKSGNEKAIVALAERYTHGNGLAACLTYAKWAVTLRKKTLFPLPSIPFLKYAFLLRSVSPVEPKITEDRDAKNRLVKQLAKEAKERKLDTVARLLVKSVAETGDFAAMIEYSDFLAEGYGGETNEEESSMLLLTAGQNGSDEAMLLLADRFMKGVHIEKNIEQALKVLTLAADRGCGEACLRLGNFYVSSTERRRNDGTAIFWYAKGADYGNKECFLRAQALTERREKLHKDAKKLLTTDPENAFRLFALSASMDYVPASASLALCYENGIGVEKNRRRAQELYRYAYEHGFEEVAYFLGRTYAYGIGTAFDFGKAVRFLTVADKLGDVRAAGELDRLYENKRHHMTQSLYSSGVRLLYRKKWSEAAKRIATAATLGSAPANYTLGCLSEFGVGVPLDGGKARELYRRAADLGFNDPQSKVKLQVLRLIR